MKTLYDSGVVNKIKDGVVLLGKGLDKYEELGLALNFEVTNASESVVQAVKA